MTDNYYMDIAIRTAKESKCKKRQVGCVIVKDNDIVATGRNGTLPGMPNTCEEKGIVCDCGNIIYFNEFDKGKGVINPDGLTGNFYYATCGKCGMYRCVMGSDVTDDPSGFKWITSDFTIHAESNAIRNAHMKGVSIKGGTMYITLSPCKECAKLIANHQISRVVFLKEYKDISGIVYLNKAKIDVEMGVVPDHTYVFPALDAVYDDVSTTLDFYKNIKVDKC